MESVLSTRTQPVTEDHWGGRTCGPSRWSSAQPAGQRPQPLGIPLSLLHGDAALAVKGRRPAGWLEKQRGSRLCRSPRAGPEALDQPGHLWSRPFPSRRESRGQGRAGRGARGAGWLLLVLPGEAGQEPCPFAAFLHQSFTHPSSAVITTCPLYLCC